LVTFDVKPLVLVIWRNPALVFALGERRKQVRVDRAPQQLSSTGLEQLSLCWCDIASRRPTRDQVDGHAAPDASLIADFVHPARQRQQFLVSAAQRAQHLCLALPAAERNGKRSVDRIEQARSDVWRHSRALEALDDCASRRERLLLRGLATLAGAVASTEAIRPRDGIGKHMGCAEVDSKVPADDGQA